MGLNWWFQSIRIPLWLLVTWEMSLFNQILNQCVVKFIVRWVIIRCINLPWEWCILFPTKLTRGDYKAHQSCTNSFNDFSLNLHFLISMQYLCDFGEVSFSTFWICFGVILWISNLSYCDSILVIPKTWSKWCSSIQFNKPK